MDRTVQENKIFVDCCSKSDYTKEKERAGLAGEEGWSMRSKQNRALGILELLKQNGTMSVRELAETFDVSEMTIRRDLELLKKTNELERSYGSATLRKGRQDTGRGGEPYDIRFEQIKNSEQKERIAQYAATLIESQDMLIMDSGTTVGRLARYVPENENISVLCYNFGILTELRRRMGVNIIFSGGYYYPEDEMFISNESPDFIRGHRANKAFLAASGFHQTLGVTCIHSHEVEMKRADIDSSATRILLLDSSKFGVVKPSFVTETSNIDSLITDSGISKEWRSIVTDMGIDLRVV